MLAQSWQFPFQAQLFLQDARRFADILNVAATDLGNDAIDEEGHTAYVLRFANGLARLFEHGAKPGVDPGQPYPLGKKL